MIRFVATDLDGTLLNDEKELPAEIFPLILEMERRGILFAPASGRQYENLKLLFAPVADKVLFICENGAIVKYRGKTLHHTPIRAEEAKRALREIRKIDGLFPVLCTESCAYVENTEEPFHTYATQSYTACKTLSSLDERAGEEDVLKIAVYDALPAVSHCMKLLPPRLPALRTAPSGPDWCDVSDPDSDKGRALRVIKEKFGFAREECLSFGDHMNDYEMLTECGHAFVPENAYPPLKALIGRTVPSNREGGVLKKIREILSEES